MNPNLSHLITILILAGRLLTGILALSAVISKSVENALFACASLAATWFVIEAGINIWHQQQEAIMRKIRDDELKRQRAEEARLRFEAAQRQKQGDEDKSYMDLDLDDFGNSDAKIPLEALMKKGAGTSIMNRGVKDESAPRQTAGSMSASELDIALIEMEIETSAPTMR